MLLLYAYNFLSSVDIANLFRTTYFTLLGITLVSFGLSIALLRLSFLFGPNNDYEDKILSYECGFDPFNDSQSGFDIHYYLVAILFIIFDLEIILLFPWALCFDNMMVKGEYTNIVNVEHFVYEIDLSGYLCVFSFLLILIIGFVYEWEKGGLDW